MRLRLLGAVLVLVAHVWGVGALGAQAQEDAPTYRGRAFLFEPQLERAVDLGWLSPGYSREEVLEEIRQSLTDRLRRSGKFVEAVVTIEDGDVFAATFVGRQAKGFEDMVIGGLAAAGRLTFHVVADEALFESCASSRAAEAEKIMAWRRENPGQPVARFNRLAGEVDGPCSVVEWLPRHPDGLAADGGPLAVRREPVFLFSTAGLEKLRIAWVDNDTLGPEVTLLGEEHSRLASFGAAAGADAELALAFDAEVMRVWPNPSSFDNPLVLVGGWDLDAVRPVIFSFAGEPLPAPLLFLEVAARELPNVKIRDSPTAID